MTKATTMTTRITMTITITAIIGIVIIGPILMDHPPTTATAQHIGRIKTTTAILGDVEDGPVERLPPGNTSMLIISSSHRHIDTPTHQHSNTF